MKFLGKLHKYKVIVELSKDEVETFTVRAYSMQEARYKAIQEQGCLDNDIITVLNSR